MFRAKLKQGKYLKRIIEGIREIFTDINFDISAKGIYLQAMDKYNIARISLNLSSEGFEEYQCVNPIKLGISIPNLAKALHCGGNEDSLTLSCDDEPSKLKVLFENKNKFNIYKFIFIFQSKKNKCRIRFIFNNYRNRSYTNS